MKENLIMPAPAPPPVPVTFGDEHRTVPVLVYGVTVGTLIHETDRWRFALRSATAIDPGAPQGPWTNRRIAQRDLRAWLMDWLDEQKIAAVRGKLGAPEETP